MNEGLNISMRAHGCFCEDKKERRAKKKKRPEKERGHQELKFYKNN